MPKISNVEIQVGSRRHTYEMHYNRSNGFFLKGFNMNWAATVSAVDGSENSFHNSYSTETDLMDSVKNTLRRYYEITSETKRVIVVRCGYGRGITMQRTEIGGWRGLPGMSNANVGMGHHSSGVELDYGVSFEWAVCVLVSSTEDKYFEVILNDKYEEIERATSQLRKTGHVMDWTPERHEFFKGMEQAMKAMASKMIAFFRDKEKMIHLIDTNQFKLLTQ